MTTATHAAILSTVSGLSDKQLLEQTSKLARLDHQIQVFVIDHLLEIDARKLYLSRGFSGLFDYVARGQGYSDASAWRRINAMKQCAHVEGARERLRDGSLTLDAAAQLQAAFERRDRERARAARRTGAGAGAARRCSRSAPGLVPPPERKPAPELDVSARKALVDEAAGKSTRQVMRMLAEMDPELVVSADRVRPLGGERWELRAGGKTRVQRSLPRRRGQRGRWTPPLRRRSAQGSQPGPLLRRRTGSTSRFEGRLAPHTGRPALRATLLRRRRRALGPAASFRQR